jgi:predicted enzyme related to lactoylglutathione lyase
VKDRAEATSGGPLISIYVDDVEETLRKVKEAGGSVFAEREVLEGIATEMGCFRDTEGNAVGIGRRLIKIEEAA